MKKLLLILIMILQAKAVILVYPDGKKEYFVPKDKQSRAMVDKVYYKNGAVSKKSMYKDTRKIYISFKDSADINRFEDKYNLNLIKETNEMFHTYLFDIKSSVDVVELCSKINKENDIRYAKPNWKAPRFTK